MICIVTKLESTLKQHPITGQLTTSRRRIANGQTERQGFSLVEMSIVLVVIGLLIGLVFTGKSLLRSSEIRSTIQSVQTFRSAAKIFQDTYFSLPGDMPNATLFWGNAGTGGTGGQCPNPSTDVGTGFQTCNGDGDGRIAATGSIPFNNNESFRFWQHLSAAKLIDERVTGIGVFEASPSFGWFTAVPGENVPELAISNTGISIAHTASMNNSYNFQSWIPGQESRVYRNAAYVGLQASGGLTWGAIYTPREAWSMDKKMDDGAPGKGDVMNVGAATNLCVTTRNEETSEYLLSSDVIACSMFIDMKF